jgi:dimethylhistidine N-methyltransferase
MPTNSTQETRVSTFVQLHRPDSAAIRAELDAGLREQQPMVSPKYLYDVLGSKLFEAICSLPEYYPTRTEAAIFEAHLDDIMQSTGQAMTLIDLGAGNCAKAARLFPALRPRQYVPVDISVAFLRDAVDALQRCHQDVDMIGIGADFSSDLPLPPEVSGERRLFFYPGSSIGNFLPEQALALLRRLRGACGRDGGLLIGADLIKDKAVLDAAYDDALGVTAAFNLNLLLHLNRLLGADFNLRHWRHRGFYDAALGRVEMHLEARHNVAVHWDGGQRRFEEGVRIHTENSYKYTQDGFIALLQQAGFGNVRCWTDPRTWFLVCHAHAV